LLAPELIEKLQDLLLILATGLFIIFIQFQARPGATSMYYADGIIIFISASCCNKSSKPGLGQGFKSQAIDSLDGAGAY